MANTQTDSTDLVVRSSTDLASLDDLDAILTGEKEAPDVLDDPESMSREIVMQLLAAETDEELQSFGSATGWRELLGLPVTLNGFKWRRSDFEEGEGSPIYFIVSATRMDDGEPVVLTTGSRNVLAQLSNMARRGTLVGSTWKLVEAEKATARGYKPLWLVKVADSTATGTEA